jgi:serine/threonine protein phosphatase 1
MSKPAPKRVLAIGDIHGCSRALDALLALVAPRAEDQVITLGDVVDRGPDSYSVLESLLGLRRTCNLVALRGNHELMMLCARQSGSDNRVWLACGGAETLASYARGGKPGTFADVPAHHWDFLEKQCVSWHETDSHFFVHANAHPEVPLDEQPDYLLYWEPFEKTAPHASGKIMVCGHTQQRTGVPRNLGHAICLDTWAYGDGWLTCLDTTTGRIWQTNQDGDHRLAWIDNFLEHHHDSD